MGRRSGEIKTLDTPQGKGETAGFCFRTAREKRRQRGCLKIAARLPTMGPDQRSCLG